MLSNDPTSRVKPLAEALKSKRFKLQPRYTTVIHQVRKRLALSMPAYCVIDSIAKLSNKPDHQWCTRSKDEIAEFLMISRRTVFNAIDEGLKKGLLEKNERGDLRVAYTWIETVELYQPDDETK
jgi:DNA-binding MarR family transcriptional regulator